MVRTPSKIAETIGLIILFSVIVTGAEDGERKCLKRNGNFPIPGSMCQSYFQCKNWRPVGEKTCKSGEHFSSVEGWCVRKELFPCLEKPKSKECLRPNGSFLKAGTGCVAYFRCCNGQAKEKKCEKGKLFDDISEKCVTSNKVTCKEKTKSEECPRPNGRFVRKGSGCVWYYDCRNGVAKARRCEKGKLFHQILEKCVTSRKVTCEDDTNKESTSSESTSEESSEESKEEIFLTTSVNNKVSVSVKPIFSTATDDIRPSTKTPIISTNPTDMISHEPTVMELSTSYLTSEIDFDETTFKTVSSDLTFEDNILTGDDTSPKSTTDTLLESTSVNSISPDVSTMTTSPDSSSEVVSSNTPTFPDSRSSPSVTMETTIKHFLSTTADSTTIDPAIVGFVCPEPTGYFPHPSEKHKFIGCVHGRPSVLTCPSNLVYNQKYRRCTYEF